jgi:hypothetical protein
MFFFPGNQKQTKKRKDGEKCVNLCHFFYLLSTGSDKYSTTISKKEVVKI